MKEMANISFMQEKSSWTEQENSYEKFEGLKRELCEMGMFSDEYKQRIPAYVKTVGIVTAQNGAAEKRYNQCCKT